MEKVELDFNQHGIGSTPTCNVVDTVLKMREQRTGMVQSKVSPHTQTQRSTRFPQEQYMFCYLSIQEAIERLRYNKLADLLYD